MVQAKRIEADIVYVQAIQSDDSDIEWYENCLRHSPLTLFKRKRKKATNRIKIVKFIQIMWRCLGLLYALHVIGFGLYIEKGTRTHTWIGLLRTMPPSSYDCDDYYIETYGNLDNVLV